MIKLTIFCLLFFYQIANSNVIEEKIQKIENLSFQNIYNNEDLAFNPYTNEERVINFFDSISLKDKKSYYNNVILDIISNNDIYPSYSSKLDFFFNKINKLSQKKNSYIYLNKIFNTVMFKNFINPVYNEIYLKYLFDSAKFEELCGYYSTLDIDQKNFTNNLVYSSICLLEAENFSQLELLLELYDDTTKTILNSTFLLPYLNDKLKKSQINIDDLDLLDKYIVYKNPHNFTVANSDFLNILDLQIYLNNDSKINPLLIFNAYQNNIINKPQLTSIFNGLNKRDSIKEYLLYKKITSQININTKLKNIEKVINEIDINLYDFSQLIQDQFSDMRILDSNLRYPKSLMLLLLSSNQNFANNFLLVSQKFEYVNEFDILFFTGLNNLINNKKYIDTIEVTETELLFNPAIKFFIENNYVGISIQNKINLTNYNKMSYVRDYSNIVIYAKSNLDQRLFDEYLSILGNLNFESTNDIDINYLVNSLDSNPFYRNFIFNLLGYHYLSR